MHDQAEIPHADLLRDIDALCERLHLPRSKFGMEAIGDPSLVRGLEGGRELRRATLSRVRQYIAEKTGASQ